MSETKPLPCPCCGEDLLTRADILLTWHPRNECVLRGVSFCSEREDVIAAWNKRAPALTPKQEAAEEMFEALHFYVAICGNTAARIGRESAQQAYELAAKALAKAGRA